MDRWNPTEAARLVTTHRVTASAGAPIHLSGLLQASEQDAQVDLSSLGSYLTGAASVTPSVIRRAASRGVTAFRSYGMTEHPTISLGCSEDPLDKRAETDGRLSPGTRVRFVDDHGVDVAPGHRGEILTRGPERFDGYDSVELATDSMLDGWFRTGDIGCLDDEGYLTVTDRKKDIIVRGGENISARELEEVLGTHPAVVEAAAVPFADTVYGERVCAFVVLRVGHRLELDGVRAHFVACGLARYKTPERLEVLNELPRTASGKVRKHLLREWLTNNDAHPQAWT
jgi:cyclohexanecarboxylate-CoA ligase